MILSDFSWNARWQIPSTLWRSNTLLYVLIGAFALAGAILLGLNVARSYQQTLELHSRQLDVGAMVTEDYLSQTLEQTRLLLLDRASQWKQLPEPARQGAPAQMLLQAGLQGMSHVRSVSLVDAQGVVRASSEPGNLGQLLPEAPQRGALIWLSQAYPGRDLTEAGHPQISDAPGFVLAALPLDIQGGHWWAVATLSPETFRNYFSRLEPLADARLEVYRYDGVPLFAYGSGLWLSAIERQERFGVQLAEREIGQAAERLRNRTPVMESYRAARRMPLVVMLSQNKAQMLQDWRQDLELLLWIFTPLLAGLASATLVMVRQRISAAKVLEQRSMAEIRRLSQLIDSLPDAVVVLGRGGFPLHGNPVWQRFAGGLNPHDSLPSLYRARAGDRPVTEAWLGKLARVLQGEAELQEEELSLFDAQGQPRIYQLTLQRLAGASDAMVLVQHDLTDSHARANKLRYLSSHDELTGLYNRACFNELLGQALESQALPLAVLFIDLDHFKEINDTHGHQVGDAILVEAARRLQEVVRATDIVGRYGGDEFVIVLGAPALPALAERVAHRLNQQLNTPFDVNGQRYLLSASIGIAHAPAHGRTLQALVAAADEAMYQSKAAGRNRATCYTPPPLPY